MAQNQWLIYFLLFMLIQSILEIINQFYIFSTKIYVICKIFEKI
jgi:hypothetical protein